MWRAPIWMIVHKGLTQHTHVTTVRCRSMKRRLGPTQSPVVSTTLNRRQTETRAASAFRWGTVCVLVSLPLLLDLYFHLLSYYSGLSIAAVWYAEVVVVVVLAVSGLYDCVFFSRAMVSQPHIKLTPAQRKLLRVPVQAKEGYETVDTPTTFGTPLPPSSHSTPSQVSPLTLLTPSRSHLSSTHSTPYTPHTSPHSPYPTPSSLVHSSHSTPAYRLSPFGGEVISSQRGLETYLKAEGERELHLVQGSPDVTWTGRQTLDHPSPLRKYHVATRSQSPGRHGDSHSPLINEEDAVWAELGIGQKDLVRWTENCRRWLAETVVVPVAREIDTINQVLSKGATPGVEIGAASLGTLRRECKTKGPQVPTLHLVLPYLELSAKQGYLVQRIRELAKGSCLGAYRWNGGGTWKGRAWTQDLPSDPQIVLHLLCTYLDSHLPLSPLSPDGRPFSSQYLLKYPDKPEAKKSEVTIYQSSVHPPQYEVLVGENCIEIPKGRNNLFHCIVVFLLHLKKERGSMLGSANLSLSGINILWIVE